jgi:hypothetical protein
LAYQTNTAATAQSLLFNGTQTISVRCVPNGSAGSDTAQVALDYIEVRVRYVAQ